MSSRTTRRLIARFAIPAVLPNLATPAGGAYVTVAMSQFSDSAVAGWAVLGRIIPIAFGTIFSLSGSIGADHRPEPRGAAVRPRARRR